MFILFCKIYTRKFQISVAKNIHIRFTIGRSQDIFSGLYLKQWISCILESRLGIYVKWSYEAKWHYSLLKLTRSLMLGPQASVKFAHVNGQGRRISSRLNAPGIP